jgi:hypothetical protein
MSLADSLPYGNSSDFLLGDSRVRMTCFLLDSSMLPHKMGRKDLEDMLPCWIIVAAKLEDYWDISCQLSKPLCSAHCPR